MFNSFMVETENKNNKVAERPDSPTERGYLPLQILSDRYGYAKDYIGWLSRTGRIQAVRYGKYGQWYASQESLKKYQLSLISSRRGFSRQDEASNKNGNVFRSGISVDSKNSPERESVSCDPVVSGSKPADSFSLEQLLAKTPNVLLLSPQTDSFTAGENVVLCKNEGSLSAELIEPERINPMSVRVNAILTLTIVLGGILFFVNFFLIK